MDFSDYKIEFEQLTEENFEEVRKIDRSDISLDFVDSVEHIMELTRYGFGHNCIGHTFAVKYEKQYIGVILLGEAIEWETDPPEMKKEPFYRLMGFIIDRNFRGKGIGGFVLEKTIEICCRDFGIRPIALGCHKDNIKAEKFYLAHGFHKTGYMEGNDFYFIRYPDRT